MDIFIEVCNKISLVHFLPCFPEFCPMESWEEKWFGTETLKHSVML